MKTVLLVYRVGTVAMLRRAQWRIRSWSIQTLQTLTQTQTKNRADWNLHKHSIKRCMGKSNVWKLESCHNSKKINDLSPLNIPESYLLMIYAHGRGRMRVRRWRKKNLLNKIQLFHTTSLPFPTTRSTFSCRTLPITHYIFRLDLN